MKSSFDFQSGDWIISWPQRVGQYNIAYQTPPADPFEALAVGNGELGALVWTESSKIIIVLNRSDLWDEIAADSFRNWKASQEDKSTTMRHGCRIIIDFNLPVFETIYLKNFEGVLDISEGSLKMCADTPFGEIAFSAFIDCDSDVLACRLEPRFAENVEYEIKVERFGSRTFSHWYYLVNRDPAIGLEGTASFADKKFIGVEHKLSCGRFAAGVSIPCKAEMSTPNKYTAKALLKSADGKIDFYAALTSPAAGSPINVMKDLLFTAENIGYDKLLELNQSNWKEFWLRSIVHTSDEYLDNLWHLAMYYLRSSQGGKYPGRFINANWGWFHDAQPWNFYFHWNQQCLYWPLNAAGHNDLLDSYLDYRFNSLVYAKKDAENLLGRRGAFVSDVTDKDGRNSTGEIHNFTPVAQIAVEFWKQYRYTGDKDFLHFKAIPYLYEASLLFADLFELGADGRYHPIESCGFEGWIKLKDSVALISCGMALFSAAVSAFKEAGVYPEFTTRLETIAANMCEFAVFSGIGKLIDDKTGSLKLDRGMFKGSAALGEYVLAAGYSDQHKMMLSSTVPDDSSAAADDIDLLELLYKLQKGQNVDIHKADMKHYSGIHSASENAAVFPSGAVGLKDKGKPVFEAAVNTAMLYAPEMLGWDTLPIVMARLGMGKEMYRLLQDWPDRWIFNPNGFSHYGPIGARIGEFFFKNRTVNAEDASTSAIDNFSDVGNVARGDIFPWQTWNFRHLGLEPLAVLACALNESLLQSYDGYIRVFPAIEENQHCRFTLHSEGGFIVSSEKSGSLPDWIYVHSRFGNMLKIINPWPVVYVYQGSELITRCASTEVCIETVAGEAYLLLDRGLNSLRIELSEIECQVNSKCKTHKNGNVILGKQRLY